MNKYIQSLKEDLQSPDTKPSEKVIILYQLGQLDKKTAAEMYERFKENEQALADLAMSSFKVGR